MNPLHVICIDKRAVSLAMGDASSLRSLIRAHIRVISSLLITPQGTPKPGVPPDSYLSVNSASTTLVKAEDEELMRLAKDFLDDTRNIDRFSQVQSYQDFERQIAERDSTIRSLQGVIVNQRLNKEVAENETLVETQDGLRRLTRVIKEERLQTSLTLSKLFDALIDVRYGGFPYVPSTERIVTYKAKGILVVGPIKQEYHDADKELEKDSRLLPDRKFHNGIKSLKVDYYRIDSRGEVWKGDVSRKFVLGTQVSEGMAELNRAIKSAPTDPKRLSSRGVLLGTAGESAMAKLQMTPDRAKALNGTELNWLIANNLLTTVPKHVSGEQFDPLHLVTIKRLSGTTDKEARREGKEFISYGVTFIQMRRIFPPHDIEEIDINDTPSQE